MECEIDPIVAFHDFCSSCKHWNENIQGIVIIEMIYKYSYVEFANDIII